MEGDGISAHFHPFVQTRLISLLNPRQARSSSADGPDRTPPPPLGECAFGRQVEGVSEHLPPLASVQLLALVCARAGVGPAGRADG